MRLKIFLLLIAYCLLPIVSKAQGYILAGSDGYGPEPSDRHFFNTNLTANGDKTHNAQKKITTINRLAAWKMYAGVLDPMTFSMDSTAFMIDNFNTSIFGHSELQLFGGTLNESTIQLSTARIQISNATGDVEIDNLDRDNSEDDVVGINSSTGKVVLKKALPSYDEYVAIVEQSGSEAPTATVLDPLDAGNPTWDYVSTGNYTMTTSNDFTLSKTVAFITMAFDETFFATITHTGDDALTLIVRDKDGNTVNINGSFYITVRVYP